MLKTTGHYGGLLRPATPHVFSTLSFQLFSLVYDRYMIVLQKNFEKKIWPNMALHSRALSLSSL